MTPLVLASASPRRKALLAALGVPFTVRAVDTAETNKGPSPEAIVRANARAKRDAAVESLTKPSIVIGADTLVFLEGAPLGKPAGAGEARAMLRRLSGRTHHVITGVAVTDMASGDALDDAETTAVTFRHLVDDEIARFVDVVQPMDRAGAYTVDGPGSLLVARYEGCYQNVLGLPIVKLDLLLRRIGVRLFRRIDAAAAVFL